jgi:hypothetical protein
MSAIQELKDMAERLGVDIGELLQMVMSLQQAFASGSASSNGWQIFERIAGQFATGAGQGVIGLLGNSAAQGVGALQNGQVLGGSKKKRKTYRKQKKMRRKHKKSSKRK